MRVTEAEVRVLKNTYLSNYDTFIATANNLINKVSAVNPELTDEELELAELYMTCHFLCAVNPEKTSEKLEGWSATYNVVEGIGILSTRWGQMANQVLNGTLSNLNATKQTKISFV